MRNRSPLRVRARRGRLLLECLVSMVLLSGAGLALAAGTRATAMLGDDATLVANAHSMAAALAEGAHAAPCERRSAQQRDLPRVRVSASTAPAGSLQRSQLTASLRFSPMARRAPAELTLSTATACP